VKYHILCVDDEPEILQTIKRTFHGDSYSLITATSGKDALTILAQNTVCLIISDMRMPEMNGIEFLEKAKAICPDAIRMILSGYSDVTSVLQAVNEQNVWCYIPKPWQVEDLRQAVRNGIEMYESRFAEKQLLALLEQKNSQLQESQSALEYVNKNLEALIFRRTEELTRALGRLAILDKTKKDFLSVLSHELRTPLNRLFGISELVFMDVPDDPQMKQYQGLFEQSRERILALLDNVLIFAQDEVVDDSLDLSTLAIDHILTSAIDENYAYATTRDVGIIYETNDAHNICGNEDLLIKAFRLLLKSAVNLCPDNKKIYINQQSIGDCIEINIVIENQTLSAHTISIFFEALCMKNVFTPGGDMGLDPVIANRLILLCGGTVCIENLPRGVGMTIVLKASLNRL
jgi:YesN/AraC family two-component response regulator